MKTQLQTVNFHNQTLLTIEQNNIHYVAMKPICENIGLAWNAQLLRIKRDEVLSQGMIVMITPTNGGEQEMVCLPIQYLNGWLFGIDVKRVKPEIRETLITYKRECYQALFDYWNKGKAERSQTTVDDRTGLRDAVNMLVSKKGLIYSDAYQLIHQRFNVNHIDELSKEQLPQAVEYVHKLVLEGELIEPPKKQIVEIPHEGRWLVIVNKHNPQNYRIKNMDGCNFVDHKKARQLLQETHQTADLLLELSRRMRLIDGYYEENFNTPIAETRNRTLI
ncbi:phage antirepressor N-terminal domain-containing protein [Avibacterium sp. 20-15]|uniref:phage antirepressor N-terminal domain-containing protein n=1 Tax=unclassified Avibacterium TaxID=2685287 RepID=UPI00202750D8|nr:MULTISPECIES: phage antirepressor N-terminal domain-containing protein [unclassified Avibacterium]MCW9731901.1 phage antirepressor N-terminal domain-containing protein [Avibacterium sp. 20-15]URL04090.1 phage antirepressor N-terminal domain-containing protein [Avibacterium sp. 20-132]